MMRDGHQHATDCHIATMTKLKNSPRDVNDISWVVSKFFFSYPFYFFIFIFITNNCFIDVITTSMAIAVPWNISWVNNDNGRPPTPWLQLPQKEQPQCRHRHELGAKDRPREADNKERGGRCKKQLKRCCHGCLLGCRYVFYIFLFFLFPFLEIFYTNRSRQVTTLATTQKRPKRHRH